MTDDTDIKVKDGKGEYFCVKMTEADKLAIKEANATRECICCEKLYEGLSSQTSPCACLCYDCFVKYRVMPCSKCMGGDTLDTATCDNCTGTGFVYERKASVYCDQLSVIYLAKVNTK